MRFRQNKSLVGKVTLLLLMIMLLAVMGGVTGLGCIERSQPLGWSGGAIVGDILYVGSKEGRLVAVNLVNDSRQWSVKLEMSGQAGGFGCIAPTAGGGCTGAASGMAIYGTPAVADGLVHIAGYNGKVYAFDASTLEMRWVYPREGNLQPIVGGPAVAQGMLYIGATDKKDKNLWKLYALDAATGNEKWQFETGDKVWSTPAVSGNTVYFSSFDNKLYALDALTGAEKWIGPFETEGAIAASPLLYNDMVYIGSFDRHFYAVEATTGKQVWKYPVTNDANKPENWFWAQPIAYENVIYAPNLDGKVYVLHATTGDEVVDAIDLGSPVSSSPVLVDSTIILASQKGVLFALDTVSQQLRQLIDIGEEVYGPLSASGEVVYIHTQDLTIHAVYANSGANLKTISLKSGE